MEKLVVQASTPTMSDLISIQLRDWDGVGKDDIIGTSKVFFFLKKVLFIFFCNPNNFVLVFVRFSEIVEKKTIDWSVPRWVNVYGYNQDFFTSVAICNFFFKSHRAPEVLTKKDLALKINTGKLDGVIFRGRFLMSAVAHQVPDVANYVNKEKFKFF